MQQFKIEIVSLRNINIVKIKINKAYKRLLEQMKTIFIELLTT